MMMSLNERKILVASEAIDFRLSIDGLVRFIAHTNADNPHDGSVYVFYNKNKNRIKLLFWDVNGFVLYYKKLENGVFFLSNSGKDTVSLTQDQLDLILSGCNPRRIGKVGKE